MFKTYKQYSWPLIEQDVLQEWEKDDTFKKSVDSRPSERSFVFYEGPPSANGLPGIHHVMSRTLKDVFCRYKTMRGYRVERKGGWDTHGLPIELQVEKRLGITKEDIGKAISIEDYNRECRTDVMKFKGKWDELTRRIGYWVDLEHPYVTYENEYIESVWSLLKALYDKGYLYKGYSIQPYSPAAGTGLSSHELSQPGTYKMVKDTSAVAQFRILPNQKHSFTDKFKEQFQSGLPVYFLAWTTTPWTLPSNTGLAVGKQIQYSFIRTFNPYTFAPQIICVAEELIPGFFKPEGNGIEMSSFQKTDKFIPWIVENTFTGSECEGLKYEQLLPFEANKPENISGKSFIVVCGDFVSTAEGTGIVHLAPSFGADDFQVAKQNGLGALTLVNKQGRFIDGVGEFSGLYVKNYKDEDETAPSYKSTDVLLSIKLKEENKAFRVEKYEHSYPHCWRTDKPILFYPLENWFVKTTAVKERMVELNKTISWKPLSTGEGRFGNWLDNLVDWNLSRSRYWGTPLPIWRTAESDEEICIGSIAMLESEITKANEILGLHQNVKTDDLHRPFVDDVVLVSPSGKPMKRESDLIDVWFDSGAMPYAQWHYMYSETGEKKDFPADFIAEGIDQTRGWFFTLHAIAVMLFDSVAYKNVLANGLVLDKNGNKMSKRLGNAVDPFVTVEKYGADALRWYLLSNASPWDNLKFDENGIAEIQRKLFGTLANTYSFFVLYANIDKFDYSEQQIDISKRPEIDRWILSELNSLIVQVSEAFDDYDPTIASRKIEKFVTDNLSNWYVRLCRRRFWKGDYSADKISAYQTLFTCLKTISQLMAPIAPFYAHSLFSDLVKGSKEKKNNSVHLSLWPDVNKLWIDNDLEETMQLAQDLSSMVLGLRKKQNIRVRQPLQKIMVPVKDETFKRRLMHVESLILNEVNVKELKYLDAGDTTLVRRAKPNFKTLGPKAGAHMKQLGAMVSNFSQDDIRLLEQNGKVALNLGDEQFELALADVEIQAQDISGWLVNSEGGLTVALDIHLTDELIQEGQAREFVNRLQNIRKDKGFEVTDKIRVKVLTDVHTKASLNAFISYIRSEILADSLVFVDSLDDLDKIELEEINCKIEVYRI